MLKKEEVINNCKFRMTCEQYGLDYENIEVYNNIIIVKAPRDRLYVLFDENFNTIKIVKCNNDNYHLDKNELVKEAYYQYCHACMTIPLGIDLPYLHLKEILELGNRIEIRKTNYNHLLSTKINGKWYDDRKGKETYFQLLSYIKFLQEQLKRYFWFSYQMAIVGFETPEQEVYIDHLVKQINEYVDICIEKNERTNPVHLLNYLGEDPRKLNLNDILCDVIDFLVDDKGFVFNEKNNKFEKINPNIKKKSLYGVYQQLLKILELSVEDFERLKVEVGQKMIERYLSSLNIPLISNDEREESTERGPILRKSK